MLLKSSSFDLFLIKICFFRLKTPHHFTVMLTSGVPRLIVGYRNKKGVIKNLKLFNKTEIVKLSDVSK